MTKKNNRKQAEQAGQATEDLMAKGEDFSKKLPVFGHVMWLYMQSQPHKYYCIQDMEWRVLSPIMLEQCKLYIKTKTTGLPMAFVSWAYLSEEAAQRYVQTYRLAPGDWNSGKNLWIIDMLAPFGGGDKIYQELHHSIFKDQEIHFLYPSEEGGLVKTTIQALLQRTAETGSSREVTRH